MGKESSLINIKYLIIRKYNVQMYIDPENHMSVRDQLIYNCITCINRSHSGWEISAQRDIQTEERKEDVVYNHLRAVRSVGVNQ